MTDRRLKRRQASLPGKKIAITMTVLAAAVLGVSYLLPALFDGASTLPQQDRIPPKAEPREASAESTSESTSAATSSDELAPGSVKPQGAAPAWVNQAKGSVSEQRVDENGLPKQIESETLTAQSVDYQGRRVVISDEVVEKLMSGAKVSGALPTAVVNELINHHGAGTAVSGAIVTRTPAPFIRSHPVPTPSQGAPLPMVVQSAVDSAVNRTAQ
ncbi:MAG: hypothetical protein ACRC8Q_09915 [Aeromonas sp.]